MPKHFFQTVPSQQLLIIILTQNANENGPILEIPAHTIRHVRRHSQLPEYLNRTSVVVAAASNGLICDLKSYNSIQFDESFFGDSKLPKAIELLKYNSNIKALSENGSKFHKAIIIGRSNTVISLQLAMNLKNFTHNYLARDALLRVQICNFSDTPFLDNNGTVCGNFLKEIVPSGCQLSIPNNYSIISDRDTRSIDLRISSEDFGKYKTRMARFLSGVRANNQDIARHMIELKSNNLDIEDVSIILNNGQSVKVATEASLVQECAI